MLGGCCVVYVRKALNTPGSCFCKPSLCRPCFPPVPLKRPPSILFSDCPESCDVDLADVKCALGATKVGRVYV